MRREKDVRRLLMSHYDVQLASENDTRDFRVIFFGPKDSPYEGVSSFFHSFSKYYSKANDHKPDFLKNSCRFTHFFYCRENGK